MPVQYLNGLFRGLESLKAPDFEAESSLVQDNLSATFQLYVLRQTIQCIWASIVFSVFKKRNGCWRLRWDIMHNLNFIFINHKEAWHSYSIYPPSSPKMSKSYFSLSVHHHIPYPKSLAMTERFCGPC